MESSLGRNYSASAWPLLRSCGISLTGRNETSRVVAAELCHSARYKHLPSKLPPLSLGQLQLPAHTRSLFFGHSYSAQLVSELLCAGSYVLRSRPLTSCTGRVMFAEIHDEPRNVTIVLVSNVQSLQHSDEFANTLPVFLSNHAPLDFVMFMPPHPDCFFEYMSQICHNVTTPPCFTLHTASDNPGMEDRNQLLWKLLRRSALVSSVWINPWTLQGNPYWAAQIDGSTHVRKYPCGTASCSHAAIGHQCRASGISLLAADVTRWALHAIETGGIAPLKGRSKPARREMPARSPAERHPSRRT